MSLTLFRKKSQAATEILDVSRVLKPSRASTATADDTKADNLPNADAKTASDCTQTELTTERAVPSKAARTSPAEAEAALAAAAAVAEEISRQEAGLGSSLDPEAEDPAPSGPRRSLKDRLAPWSGGAPSPLAETIDADIISEALPQQAEDPEPTPKPDRVTAASVPAGKLSGDRLFDALTMDDEIPAADDTAPANADLRGSIRMQAVSRPGLLERLTPFTLWLSVGLVLASFLYAGVVGGVSLPVIALFAGGIFLFSSILFVASVTGAYSPLLLAGVLLRRPMAKRSDAHTLGGRDVLTALGLAETLLDADVDARLVTTREGVVVYGNEQYVRIARQAGVSTTTGLPPRIDRLFAQASGQSSKMFRLARAARSGQLADEIITQTMGGEPGATGPRRRFEVSVRPMSDKGQHVAWRLRELPVEDVKDSYRTSYEHYPRPVLALEKSGNVSWLNQAAKELMGIGVVRDIAISDIFLGEPRDLIDGLWEDDPEEIEGRIRSKSSPSGNVSVVFTPFVKAGVGEGFVCVEMVSKSEFAAAADAPGAASDVTDAPFGVAFVEGDVTSDAKLTSVNKLFAEKLNAKEGMRLSETLSADAMRDLVAAMRAKSQSKALTRPVDVFVGEGADGLHLRLMARPIKRRRGAYGPRQMVLYLLDVSFQKRMEEDYAHDKRLKAIGKIAGSVAHDFNNFLQAMMGATEFLMRRHPAGDPSYPDLVSIRENAQRARNLTSNLLAFSRKQTLQPEVMSVTELLSDFTPFVQRYVTEKVKVVVDHGRHVGAIKADRSQLELAVMNLAVNARDAMDKGGTLTISSKRVPAAEVADYGYQVLDEVDHVLIEMADTGSGVPADIADKIFEPFFTTKGEGKGTGLGLSTVHGIIGQLGGRIFLYNRPGEGATFRIFLPAVSEEEAALAAKAKPKSSEPSGKVDDLTGKGRILIVEDEDSVRSIVVRALGMCGYEIVEACDGDEALEMIEDAEEPFDVVLSDIMMPEMDGPTLIQEAGEKLGKAKVIFMSGYAEAAMRDKLQEIEDARYLQKPFTLKKVAAVVKEAMAE